jgi:hypothetical protein
LRNPTKPLLQWPLLTRERLAAFTRELTRILAYMDYVTYDQREQSGIENENHHWEWAVLGDDDEGAFWGIDGIEEEQEHIHKHGEPAFPNLPDCPTSDCFPTIVTPVTR